MEIKIEKNPRNKREKGSAEITFTEQSVVRVTSHEDGSFLISAGYGAYQDATLHNVRSLIRQIVRIAKDHKVTQLLFPNIEKLPFTVLKDFTISERTALISEQALIALYIFDTYKTTVKKNSIEKIILEVADEKKGKEGVTRGTIIGTLVNECRTISNTPGNDLTPQGLADAAKKAVRGTKVQAKVLNLAAIKKEKMGGLLSVGKGSSEEPRFIVLEYWGAGKKEKPIVFVGKGITFDTGGINIKPSDGLSDMHLDMSGGAAVIAAVSAIAKLGIKRNVIGLIPAAENMVSGNSYRTGDIITTMSGKTVEVHNTDAEGRIVLADGLTYAKRYNPALIIDIATLTGAALVALGQHASAVFSGNDVLASRLVELGERSGDRLWHLPLWKEYINYTKGTFADIANLPNGGSPRFGGAINGAAFLSHFTDIQKWAHIDIAPRMVSAPGDHLSKGAAGEPVRLLIAIAEDKNLVS